jgi:hypothetical protein
MAPGSLSNNIKATYSVAPINCSCLRVNKQGSRVHICRFTQLLYADGGAQRSLSNGRITLSLGAQLRKLLLKGFDRFLTATRPIELKRLRDTIQLA